MEAGTELFCKWKSELSCTLPAPEIYFTFTTGTSATSLQTPFGRFSVCLLCRGRLVSLLCCHTTGSHRCLGSHWSLRIFPELFW